MNDDKNMNIQLNASLPALVRAATDETNQTTNQP